ncbi:hypothetical protein BV25DRAFT_1816733, partial [Artomyces pyxidatus]
HGLAKLEMHTDTTLDVLSEVVRERFADAVNDFQVNTCSQFQTLELEREKSARLRREEKKANSSKANKPTGQESLSDNASDPARQKSRSDTARKEKGWNVNTYKFHRLGDYVSTIRNMGVTGSYSTQRFELEHKKSKTRYLRTSRRTIALQLSRIETRERRIRNILIKRRKKQAPAKDLEDVIIDSQAHYSTGKTQNYPINVPKLLLALNGDPAIDDFDRKLKQHLLPRILDIHRKEEATRPSLWRTPINGSEMARPADDDPSDDIYLRNDCIYLHKRMYFHFTTYDVKRGTDLINPGTSRHNIMLLDDGTSGHHFVYARVLGVYHTNVVYTGQDTLDYEPRRLDFLWVRWYDVINPDSSGWDGLDFVSFPPVEETDAFGFVDPNDVLRGCHIVPDFASGKRRDDGAGLSGFAKDGEDYNRYYICRFSERDLLMRYHWGLGIGHMHAHDTTATSRAVAERKAAKERANLSASVLTSEAAMEDDAHLDIQIDQPHLDLRPDDAYDSDETVLGMDDGSDIFDDVGNEDGVGEDMEMADEEVRKGAEEDEEDEDSPVLPGL